MDLTSGTPYWPLESGLLTVHPPLKADEKCEVAIIGGGITGAIVAYYLVDAGIDVVMVDQREFGWGSTSASTALLQYEIDVPLHKLIELRGKAVAERAYLLCLQSIHTLHEIVQTLEEDCVFSYKKSLYLASSKRDVDLLEKECKARQAAGIKVDFLTQADIESRFAFSRPAALLSYDAAQLDPYRLTHNLLKWAKARGMRAYDRTRVEKIEQVDGGVQLKTNRDATIHAKRIVMATGYEAQDYLKEKVTDLASTYALISAPVPAFTGWGEEQCLIWETGEPYLYLRTTPDNRIIVGGEDVPFHDPKRRDKLITKKCETLLKKFRKMFPDIELDVDYTWTGTFSSTKDGLAYIGETDQFPNACFALGYGGNGITYSVVAAEIIRDVHLGISNKDGEIFRFGR